MPHCDQRVLHAPGECRFCDAHPEWQALREAWGINYTGHSNADKVACPAEALRPVETINKWYGNVPAPANKHTPSIFPDWMRSPRRLW